MDWPLPKPSKSKQPSRFVNGVRTMRDGREITNSREWLRRKEQVRREQGYKCARFKKCKAYIFSGGELHHKNGTRGLGGGKRDDRKENLELLCDKCHDAEHNKLWA